MVIKHSPNCTQINRAQGWYPVNCLRCAIVSHADFEQFQDTEMNDEILTRIKRALTEVWDPWWDSAQSVTDIRNLVNHYEELVSQFDTEYRVVYKNNFHNKEMTTGIKTLQEAIDIAKIYEQYSTVDYVRIEFRHVSEWITYELDEPASA